MKVVIAGAGSYGQVYSEYLREQSRFEVVGFLDDDPEKKGEEINLIPVLGSTTQMSMLDELGVEGLFAPIGNSDARLRILKEAGAQGIRTPNFIHETAVVAENSLPSENQGVYVLPGSIVMPFVEFDDFVMISMGVKIAHHTKWGEGAFVSTGANVGASLEIGRKAFLGIGCNIMTGVKHVGRDATVGAGAVVIRDVPDGATVVGNPARVIKQAQSTEGRPAQIEEA